MAVNYKMFVILKNIKSTFSVIWRTPPTKSGWPDSNRRPLAPHASTLANCATPRFNHHTPRRTNKVVFDLFNRFKEQIGQLEKV